MKLIKLWIILAFIGIVTGQLVIADESSHHPAPPPMPKDFDRLKQLVGTWDGFHIKDGKSEPAVITYEVVSGGTAVLERMHPGTSHEMATIYFAEGKDIGATHYCMLGNHPKMMLKNPGKRDLHFEMVDSTGLQSPLEPHIHALTMTIKDGKKLEQKWVYYENDKPKETTVMKFSRKP